MQACLECPRWRPPVVLVLMLVVAVLLVLAQLLLMSMKWLGHWQRCQRFHSVECPSHGST